MATSISMASNALVLIGHDPINALSEDVAASNLYADTYAYVLSEHPWSFAMKERSLSRLSAAPDRETGYSYAFQMPTDIIRMWAVFPTCDYRIVGELIYSNTSSMLGRYIYTVDETQLPAHFVKAMEYKLASEFSISVAEDAEKMMSFLNMYKAEIASAMAKDSQQHPSQGIVRNPIRMGRSRR